MAKRKSKDENKEIDVFTEFFKNLLELQDRLSIEDLDVARESLLEAQRSLEKEALRKKQEEAERKRVEKERIKKEAHEKHVAEVTCMDLPLDWENFFAGDERVAGVHTDSIPDALIICLNTLGRVDIEYISEITGRS